MRKKGRRLAVLGMVVAVLVWLGVRGLENESNPLDPDPAESGLGEQVPRESPGLAVVTAAAPMSESSADPALADLFWGELRRLEAATRTGDVTDAWMWQRRANELLPDLPLQDPLREQFEVASANLQAYVTQRCAQTAAELRNGRVLAAAQLLKSFRDGAQALPSAVQAVLEAHGLEAVMAKIGSAELPALPRSIEPGRRVRMVRDDRLVLGQVLKSSGDVVTVKLRSTMGLMYPEVPCYMLGLVDPQPAEALDQSLRALHGGDGLLAGLWLTLASHQGAGGSPMAVAIGRCLGR